MAAQTKKPGAVNVVPLFKRGASFEGEEELPVGLPPSAVPSAGPVAKAGVDLGGLPPVWFLVGAGWSGKTMLARWLGWRTAEEGRAAVLAALDPQNRTLPGFFEGVAQPPNADPTQTARWLRELVEWVMGQKAPAILDMGGGDTSLAALIDNAPTVAADMEEAGVAPVAAYLLGPRVDDLASLDTFEARGFKPKATAIILNEGRVEGGMEREEAFARVLRHSAVKRAMDRGAVQVWLPRLDPPEVAQEIEAKRLTFGLARDGLVPEGKTFAPIGGLNRSAVRRWLDRMEAEFAPVRGWLP
ncbi:hypothetical protein [Muricoccus pecuniae]|uniref:Uncharacterized protein n=1 Tax=Muricoccus pecuniae TaxID=693023 RepID=A0A840YMS0_9PROT|nr:hypothetical protein [Roseomonas pecuniae]MBB5696044.1 hypothetical protein [Roseomonas pecuniae]